MNQQDNIKVCIFGRVSSDKQDASRQVHELNMFCSDKNYVVTEKILSTVTGSKSFHQREDLQRLFSLANKKRFDKVIVTEISRLGRKAKDIRNTLDFLHSLNIPVHFKNLGMDSLNESCQETFVVNIIIAVYAELAQEEVRILSDRIKSGMQNAKAKGKQIGRRKGNRKSNEQLLKQYSKLVIDVKRGFSLNECKKLHGVSKNTVIKVKRAIGV